MAKTVIDPESGCMIWQGAGAGSSYGQIRIGSLRDGTRRMEYVHRIAWMLVFGPIPPDREIDHVKALGCKDNRCWNINHLQAVPHEVNAQRRGHQCGEGCPAHTSRPKMSHEEDLARRRARYSNRRRLSE